MIRSHTVGTKGQGLTMAMPPRRRKPHPVPFAALGTVLLAVAFLWTCSPASAHPHAWIDLRSDVVFDDDGRIAALRMAWIFDDMLSAYSVAGLEKAAGKPTGEALHSLARRNLDNLREHGFFIDIRLDGKRLAIDSVTDVTAAFADGRYQMGFTVPMASPIDPRKHQMSYSVYDPSFYIEIAHLPDEPVGLINSSASTCGAWIHQPAPNAELRSLAEAFGKDESIDEQLVRAMSGESEVPIGRLFAEKVTVQCR